MAFKLVVLATVLTVTLAYQDLTHICDGFKNINCQTMYTQKEDDETVCGSDRVTYSNFCEYSHARCADHSMVLSNLGPCFTSTAPAPTTTTVMDRTTPNVVTAKPTTAANTMPASTTPMVTTTTTPDPLLVAFCQSKNSITCPQNLEPICGSDTKFYLNQCEFSKAYCENNSLTSKDISFCTGQ
ncbi:four-domain proteases inhibitor-like [Mya arenaria]|uniref:four-domain proteases inhibitor-like n=1 Tax=Mya arenaria TaxID=6604 RepID=UPI0022E6D18C|nr:four-domain proteases inhibitor-like [Mya arenaria]